MSYFRGLEVWTEVAAVGTRKAWFGPEDLAAATLRTSLAGEESLAFTISRVHASAAEILHGRIARICYSDSSLDTEWRIADVQDQSGAGDTGQVAITCQALALDLARATYFAHDSAGRPTFDFSAVQLTATEWLAYVVAAAARLPYSVSVGTVEFSSPFDLNGDYANALEIVRAIQQPGRAPGDFVYRRNGTTDYKLDLLTSRGSSAATVRVQTAKNLLQNVRKRSLANQGTVIFPRGQEGTGTRDLSQTYWRVASVDDGTHATLEEPYGGPGPCAFADQLKNLYVARIASTFSSQQISASNTSGQITVPSTSGWSAGNLVRFFTTSGSAGKRLVSLAHPTYSLSPASGGYGPIERILDVPTAFGDSNLLANPWLNTWTTISNPPDNFARSSTLGSWTRETSIFAVGTYAQKLAVGHTAGATETTRFASPTGTPFTTSGLRFSASAWYRCDEVSNATARYVRLRIMNPARSVSYADGDKFDPADTIGNLVRLELNNVDLSAATGGAVVVLEVYVTNPTGYAYHTSYFGPMTLSESDVAIQDVLYSGGIAMWQRANALLGAIATPIAGYTVQLADLARLESGDWADEPLTLGGNIEVTDADLGLTTTQRVVNMEQNLRDPLDATVSLSTPDPVLSQAMAGFAGGSIVTGQPAAGAGDAAQAPGTKATTAAGLGIKDVYTKAQVDALLALRILAGILAAGVPGAKATLGDTVVRGSLVQADPSGNNFGGYFGGPVSVDGAPADTSTSLLTPAGTSGKSPIRLPHGAAPATPLDGDIWTTTAGLFVRVNGTTIGPLT